MKFERNQKKVTKTRKREKKRRIGMKQNYVFVPLE